MLKVNSSTKNQKSHLPFSSFIMGFLHLFIVNKSGGLILHRPLGPRAPSIGTNEWLRIGSTFHSLHAIAAEAGPVRLPGNKNSCEFKLSCLWAVLIDIHYSFDIMFYSHRWSRWRHRRYSGRSYVKMSADKDRDQVCLNVSVELFQCSRQLQMYLIFISSR
jgi:hypothetical protein